MKQSQEKKGSLFAKINESSCEGAKQTKLFDRLKKKGRKNKLDFIPSNGIQNQKECVILLTQRSLIRIQPVKAANV